MAQTLVQYLASPDHPCTIRKAFKQSEQSLPPIIMCMQRSMFASSLHAPSLFAPGAALIMGLVSSTVMFLYHAKRTIEAGGPRVRDGEGIVLGRSVGLCIAACLPEWSQADKTYTFMYSYDTNTTCMLHPGRIIAACFAMDA